MARHTPLLHGIVTAMVTPLIDQTTLDRAGLERLIEHLIGGGVHGIFPLGTTGEGVALPIAVRKDVVEQTCRLVAGRVPVMVGVTDTSLVAAVELARHAKECGASVIAAAPPYYFSLSQDEILRYMEQLTIQSEMPLMLYNMPMLTRHTLEVSTVRRAAEIESIVGLKDTGFLMGYFHEARAAIKREDFSFLIGPEELLAECVLFGGHGGMAGASNLYPRLYVDMYDAAVARDLDRVVALQQDVLAFNKAVFPSSNPMRGLKHGLNYLGICSPVLTEPLANYTAEQYKAVEKYVDEHRSKIVG